MKCLGHEVAGPALVLLFALFVLLDDAGGFGLPAVGGDDVAVVLHGLGPVVHEVLIDVVVVDQRLAGIMGQQTLGEVGDDVLGIEAWFQGFKHCDAFPSVNVEVGVHAGDEGGELRMLVNGGFDSGLVHGEVEVAGAAFPKQRLSELRADGPIAFEVIDIGGGDTALQVACDVLNVLGLLAVDVAREVEVELVLFDLRERNHPREFGKFDAAG